VAMGTEAISIKRPVGAGGPPSSGGGHHRVVDYRRVGATIRAFRIKKGWRQLDLALRAGVSRAAVSRLESGNIGGLSVDHLVVIANALDVRAELVLRWRGGELDRLLNSRHSALHEAGSLERGLPTGGASGPIR